MNSINDIFKTYGNSLSDSDFPQHFQEVAKNYYDTTSHFLSIVKREKSPFKYINSCDNYIIKNSSFNSLVFKSNSDYSVFINSGALELLSNSVDKILKLNNDYSYIKLPNDVNYLYEMKKNLSWICLMNIFLHELAHITKQHLDIIKGNTASFFFEFDNLSEFTKNKLRERKFLEYEADLEAGARATYLLNLSIITSINNAGNKNIHKGKLIEFLFFFHFLSAFLVFNEAEKIHFEKIKFTHPNIQERITAYTSGFFIALRDKIHNNFDVTRYIPIPQLQVIVNNVVKYVYDISEEMEWTRVQLDNSAIAKFHPEYISKIIEVKRKYGISRE